MTLRPLRAVLVERATPRLVELLAAALDGSGPAIVPLDAGLPPARLAELIGVLGPGSVEDAEGVTTVRSGPERGSRRRYGGHHRHLRVHRRAQGGGAERGRAAALGPGLAGPGGRPARRALAVLPARHARGRPAGPGALAGQRHRAGAGRAGRRRRPWRPPAARTSRWSRPSCSGCSTPGTERSTPLAGFSSVLLGGAAAPAGLLDRGPGRGRAGGDDLRHDRDLRRLRVRRRAAGRRAGRGPRRRRGSGSAGRCCSPATWAGRGHRRDGWFRTGDLGALDGSGRLTVRGRADDVINTGGHKVVPGEVAAALQSCPGVRDVGGGGATRPGMGRTGRRGGGAGRSGATRRPWNCSVCMCASGCRVTLLPAGS